MEDDGFLEWQFVFVILCQVEFVLVIVNDYREKFFYLRKLRYDVVQIVVFDGLLQEVLFCYLLGMLYINFSVFWDFVIEFISFYVYEMENK